MKKDTNKNNEIEQYQSKQKNNENKTKNSSFIVIKDIVKEYDDGFKAIKKINLSIEKGEFVTILGPSGCGKTTLLKLIGGFELPTSGKVLVDQIDIKDLPIQRRPTATVFQDYALFPNMNVEKNIAYGLKETRVKKETIPKDFQVGCEKYYNDCLKKSNEKIKDINKKISSCEKEIEKIENKIRSSHILNDVFNMTDEEYDLKINSIKEEFEQKTNKDLLKSIPFKIKNIEFWNNFLSFLKINYEIEYKKTQNEELIDSYLDYEKAYRKMLILKNEIRYWKYKLNDLDYWVSYWQNYPNEEKEWYETKKLNRKQTKNEIQKQINEIIVTVGLENKNKKMPYELSGGMQQRVALARALVIKPEILLLDEPLSALDAKVRVQMQSELKKLHNKFGITFILVTHDQEEALCLSDKVVVMSNGKIEQIGTPNEIYDYPCNNWVANFIGKANIFEAKYLKQKNQVNLFDQNFDLDDFYKNKFEDNQEVNAMIRPENFDVTTKKEGKIKVKVLDIIYKGLLWEFICDYNGKLICIEAINPVKKDSEIYLTWDNEDIHIMQKHDLDDVMDEQEVIKNKKEIKKKVKKQIQQNKRGN